MRYNTARLCRKKKEELMLSVVIENVDCMWDFTTMCFGNMRMVSHSHTNTSAMVRRCRMHLLASKPIITLTIKKFNGLV